MLGFLLVLGNKDKELFTPCDAQCNPFLSANRSYCINIKSKAVMHLLSSRTGKNCTETLKISQDAAPTAARVSFAESAGGSAAVLLTAYVMF